MSHPSKQRHNYGTTLNNSILRVSNLSGIHSLILFRAFRNIKPKMFIARLNDLNQQRSLIKAALFRSPSQNAKSIVFQFGAKIQLFLTTNNSWRINFPLLFRGGGHRQSHAVVRNFISYKIFIVIFTTFKNEYVVKGKNTSELN